MDSMYAEYWREKGHTIIESERGFISAIIHGGVCLINDLYVRPAYRGTTAALDFALAITAIAEERGCTQLAAEAYKADPIFRRNLKLQRHFDMVPVHEDLYKVISAKRINHA